MSRTEARQRLEKLFDLVVDVDQWQTANDELKKFKNDLEPHHEAPWKVRVFACLDLTPPLLGPKTTDAELARSEVKSNVQCAISALNIE